MPFIFSKVRLQENSICLMRLHVAFSSVYVFIYPVAFVLGIRYLSHHKGMCSEYVIVQSQGHVCQSWLHSRCRPVAHKSNCLFAFVLGIWFLSHHKGMFFSHGFTFRCCPQVQLSVCQDLVVSHGFTFAVKHKLNCLLAFVLRIWYLS